MPSFFGKYRGAVVKNDDPLKLGRLQVLVPAISEQPLTWALPCSPYAGKEEGWYFMPPLGANVWVEFEAGNLDYPIWSGCFWNDSAGIPKDASTPDMKVLQVGDKFTVIIDEKTTKLTAKVVTDKGTMKLEMDQNGIVLTADQVTATITPDKIELKKTPCTITIDDAITSKKAGASVTVSDSIALKNAASSAELQQSSIDLKNGASSISLSPATVNINNGALEVM